MSWATDQLKYAFGIGGLMSFYGIVSLIVWFGGEQMGLGLSSRVVIIALVLLTLPVFLIIAIVASRRRKKAQAAVETPAESPEAPPQLSTPSGNFDDLNKCTQELVSFLKTSNLGEAGKDAVYSLPWYIVAGAPKAGKSSLVLGSNLNFQTLPSQRQSEQKFIRPTANVDWRVTSDAVFIDTAGRYQTEGVDGEEWASLIETIKKHRSGRPLDGFLLVVSAEKILRSEEREIEEMAKVLRARLDEVIQRLKIRFPVYLIFTHADAIEGFRDSFSTSKNEGKILVWGATIPIDKSDNAQALFDSEFEALHESVMRRRLVRLSAPFTPVRQLRIFNFPLHFGSARRKFGALVNSLFRPNPFSENPFLRGFYFTAAPVVKAAPNTPQAIGNTYFTEKLFRDVLLRDKDLAKTFIAQRQKAPIFGWFVTLISLFLVFFLLVMSVISLFANKQLLDEATEKGGALLTITKTDAYKNPLAQNEKLAQAEMNATDRLREMLVRLDDNERNGAPLHMRFGLYSGNRIYKQHLLPVYMGVIEHRFKAATIAKVEADLKKFAVSNPVANPAQLTDAEEQNLGKHYDLLKAYLMLTGEHRERAEPTHISTALKDYWTTESKISADMKLVAENQLAFWAKQVDRNDEDYKFPRILPDTKLVEDTRRKLQSFPAVFRYYKRKVTEISKKIDDDLGPTTAAEIFNREGADSSLMEGIYTVPGAYTKPGLELMKTAIAEADQKLSEDDWVMGELGKKEIVRQSTDASRIEERYYRDYADHWRAFVKGVNVRQYTNKETASNTLQAFSSAKSPMKILLLEIAKNTNLSAEPESSGWWAWIKSWFTSKRDSGVIGSSQPEKEFRPLFDFIGKKDQQDAPIEKYHTEISSVQKAFSPLSDDQIKEIAQTLAKDPDYKLGLAKRENNVSNLIQGFKATPSGQELAALLQEPLANLRVVLGADAKTQLSKMWADQILPAAKEIEKGYPFEDISTESDLTKLSAFLAPGGGRFSKFYEERLKNYFEESGGLLKVKDTSEAKFSDEFVEYLNNAFALRKALFGSSPTPKFEYEFTLRPVKDALVEVSIDGQKVTSEGTGSIKGTFPAGTATETGVIMSFASSSGTSSTSGAPLPSNSLANSANTSISSSTNKRNFYQPAGNAQLKFQGNWGLFRFVDAGRPQKQPGGEYALSYSLGGKTVGAIIKPGGGDLFDKNIFRRLRAPQNLLK